MEEQINGFDYLENAEILTKRDWGKRLVSIWNVPGTEPTTEHEEGALPTPQSFLGKERISELKKKYR